MTDAKRNTVFDKYFSGSLVFLAFLALSMPAFTGAYWMPPQEIVGVVKFPVIESTPKAVRTVRAALSLNASEPLL